MEKKTLTGILFIVSAALVALLIGYYGLVGVKGEKPASSPALTPRETETPPLSTPEPTPSSFVISMVGDCTLASSQHNDDFDEKLDGEYSRPFSGVVDYLADDYLTVANLECSFSAEPLVGSTTFYFCAPAEYANILTEGSVEFVSLANNHTTDFGEAGPAGSKAALDAVGVDCAAPDGSYVYESDEGVSVGIYCAPWIATREQVVAGVEALRAQSPDIIMVMMHWGLEGSYQVTAGQEEIGRAAIDAGADIIYGSHPHVLQRVEEYGGGYIFYSLGNFSFGGNTAPRDRDTVIAQVSVGRSAAGEVSLTGYKLIPCCLSSVENVNDYRPEPYPRGSEGYDRAISKLDGTWKGPDLTIDYSAYHTPTPAPEEETFGGDAPVEVPVEPPVEASPEE